MGASIRIIGAAGGLFSREGGAGAGEGGGEEEEEEELGGHRGFKVGGWGFWSGSVRWGEGFEGGIGSRNQLFLGTALRSKLTATRIRLTEG